MDKTLIERAIDSAKHRQYKLSADLKRDISDGHRKKAEKQKEVAEFTVMALERMLAEEQGNLAEVVHGEWIMRGGKTYCSKCGKLALRDQDRDDWWYYVQSDFCPHCGCKMGGAE